MVFELFKPMLNSIKMQGQMSPKKSLPILVMLHTLRLHQKTETIREVA